MRRCLVENEGAETFLTIPIIRQVVPAVASSLLERRNRATMEYLSDQEISDMNPHSVATKSHTRLAPLVCVEI